MKKIVRLSANDAVVRLDQMIDLIYRDVEIATATEAALESANKMAMGSLRGVQFYGADCYNAVAQSMALHLALTLAKLFEIPSLRGQGKSTRFNKSDVASIPLMVRLLEQKRCRVRLSKRARDWTPMIPEMADRHAESCELAIDRAIEAYNELRRKPAGRKASTKLRGFRDKVLAHTLLITALDSRPTYREMFHLARVARQVVEHARLAISGHHLDMTDHMERRLEVAEAFWKPAMTAAAEAER
jgi:hypothetical protein